MEQIENLEVFRQKEIEKYVYITIMKVNEMDGLIVYFKEVLKEIGQVVFLQFVKILVDQIEEGIQNIFRFDFQLRFYFLYCIFLDFVEFFNVIYEFFFTGFKKVCFFGDLFFFQYFIYLEMMIVRKVIFSIYSFGNQQIYQRSFFLIFFNIVNDKGKMGLENYGRVQFVAFVKTIDGFYIYWSVIGEIQFSQSSNSFYNWYFFNDIFVRILGLIVIYQILVYLRVVKV